MKPVQGFPVMVEGMMRITLTNLRAAITSGLWVFFFLRNDEGVTAFGFNSNVAALRLGVVWSLAAALVKAAEAFGLGLGMMDCELKVGDHGSCKDRS